MKPRHPIMCPQLLAGEAHQLKTNARILDHGLLRCTHRPSAGQGECNAQVWVCRHPNGWHYVAVLSVAEVRYMEHRHMSADEALTYLGAELPPEAR